MGVAWNVADCVQPCPMVAIKNLQTVPGVIGLNSLWVVAICEKFKQVNSFLTVFDRVMNQLLMGLTRIVHHCCLYHRHLINIIDVHVPPPKIHRHHHHRQVQTNKCITCDMDSPHHKWYPHHYDVDSPMVQRLGTTHWTQRKYSAWFDDEDNAVVVKYIKTFMFNLLPRTRLGRDSWRKDERLMNGWLDFRHGKAAAALFVFGYQKTYF